MAKKAQSTLINMLLSLTAIALVAAAALALMNAVTEEPIKVAKQNKVNKAIENVLKQVDENGETLDSIDYKTLKDTIVKAGGEEMVCHLAYNAEGEYAGAAVETSDSNGFGGILKVMVGFDKDGNVYGYSILESNETPGLGAKADKWFQLGQKGQVVGKSPATEPQSELRVTKDTRGGGTVDAITGSTITSKAFLRSVNKAYTNLQTVLNK
ncbi:MAG: RnfABCDGE type electron transport complex subunit G [Bacteroidales bacterium]|nr:RnfABCDGE type electron transport complex subunit G [Bacteroidales bacterium]